MHDTALLDRAVAGEMVLLDGDGEEWQLDSYDETGGYITHDGSDTHYLSHEQLAQFTLVATDAFTTTWA